MRSAIEGHEYDVGLQPPCLQAPAGAPGPPSSLFPSLCRRRGSLSESYQPDVADEKYYERECRGQR